MDSHRTRVALTRTHTHKHLHFLRMFLQEVTLLDQLFMEANLHGSILAQFSSFGHGMGAAQSQSDAALPEGRA